MNKKKLNKILVFTFALILSLYYIEFEPSWNTASRAALPLSLALESKLDISTYADFTGDKASINGVPYSDKAPLSGFILTPIIKTIDYFYDIDHYDAKTKLMIAIFLGAFLFGAIPMALIVLFTYNNGIEEKKHGTTILFFTYFSSFIFITAGGYWSHIFTAFLLILSIYFIKKNHFFYAGLAMGAAFMNEYNIAVIGFVWGLWFIYKQNWKQVLYFSLGVIPFIILLAWYNNILTGNPFELAYRYQENFQQNADNYGFTYPTLKIFYHLTISQYRGLIFYAPILAILIWYLVKKRKDKIINNSLSQMIIISSIIYLLVFTCNRSWYGGWTYGPRYLVIIPVLLFYQFLNIIELKTLTSKITFFILGIFGLVQAFLDKATILYPRTDMDFPLIDGIIPAIIKGKYMNWHIPALFGFKGVWTNILYFLLFAAIIYILHILNNHKEIEKDIFKKS